MPDPIRTAPALRALLAILVVLTACLLTAAVLTWLVGR